jgi:hypothetical protein
LIKGIMSATTFQWLVTAPNPRHPGTGVDAGQRGWKLHAITLKRGENYEEWKRRTALCGTWPRHGWGGDLFIENECVRCQKAMTKREAAGEVFIDLNEVYRAEREQVEQQLWAIVREREKAGGDMSDDDIEALRKELQAALAPT